MPDDMILPDAQQAPLALAPLNLPDRKPRLSEVYDSVAQVDPARAAKISVLTGKLGEPASFIDKNLPEIEKRVNGPAPSFFKELEDQYPGTGQFLSKPENMAASQDDLDNLVSHEGMIRDYTFTESMRRSLQVGLANLGAGASRVPAAIYDMYYLPRNLGAMAANLPNEVRQAPAGLVDNFASRYFEGMAAQSNTPDLERGIMDSLGKGEYAKAGRAAAAQFVANAPTQGALIVAALTGYGAPALIGAGSLQAAETLKKGRASGAEPAVQTLNALLQGSIEAGFESLGTFGLLKTWEGAISRAYGKQTARAFMRELGKTLAASVSGEANEEALTSAAQDFSDYITGVNPRAMQGSIARAIDAGIVGGLSGGALTGPAAISAGVVQAQERIRAEQAKKFYEALGDKAKSSKLRERLTQPYQELVRNLTVVGPVEKTYVSAEAFERVFQQANQDPGEAAAKLGITDQFLEARATGGSVGIPLEKMTELIDSGIYSQLSDDIKFNPDDLSINEVKKKAEEVKAGIESMQADAQQDIAADVKVKAGYDVVYQDIKKQLGAIQRPQNISEKDWGKLIDVNAQVTASHAVAEAKKRGISVEDYYTGQRRPKIVGEEGLAGQSSEAERRSRPEGETGPQERPGIPGTLPSPGSPFLPSVTANIKNVKTLFGTEPLEGTAEVLRTELLREQALGKSPEQAMTDRLAALDMTHKIFTDGLDQVLRAPEKAQIKALESLTREIERRVMLTGEEPSAEMRAAHEAIRKSIEGRLEQPAPASDPNILRQDQPIAPPFYSKLQRDIETRLQNTASVDQVRALLREAKEDEIKWSGVDLFLKGKTKIDKAELLEFLRANQFRVELRVLGEKLPETPETKDISAPSESGVVGGVGAFKRWAAGRGFSEDDLNRKWSRFQGIIGRGIEAFGGAQDPLIEEFRAQHPDLMQERQAAEPNDGVVRPTEMVRTKINRQGVVEDGEGIKTPVPGLVITKTLGGDGYTLTHQATGLGMGVSGVPLGKAWHVVDAMHSRGYDLSEPDADTMRDALISLGFPAMRDSALSEWDDSADDRAEQQRTAAGGLPSIESLSSDELREKVVEQYEDEIGELASELESENIDEYMDQNREEWEVTVEANTREAEDIDEVEDGESDGEFIVTFDNGARETYTAEDEDAAREMAEKDLRNGKIEDQEDGYKLVLNGDDYTGRREQVTWFDNKSEAETAAERATEREQESYREGMYGNTNGEEYSQAVNSFVEEVENGERELDGYHFDGSAGKKAEKKIYTWDKARYVGGNYSLAGAKEGMTFEVMIVAEALEPYNASDKTHMADVSEGKDLGWFRAAVHESDKRSDVMVANEFQNNRTQKGMAIGFKGDVWNEKNEAALAKLVAAQAADPDNDKLSSKLRDMREKKANTSPDAAEQHSKWSVENKALSEANRKAAEKLSNIKEELHVEFLQSLGEFKPLTEIPEGYNLTHNSSGAEQGKEWAYTKEGGSARSVSGYYHPTKAEAKKEALDVINSTEEFNRSSQERELNYIEKNPRYIAAKAAYEAAREAQKQSDNAEPATPGTAVPDTPFKDNSYELQARVLIRWTVEQDYKQWQLEAKSGDDRSFREWWADRGIKQIGWTTGLQQAERNNRADDVDKLVYDPVKQELSAYKNGREIIGGTKVAPEAIAERLGNSPQAREIAKRLLATEPQKRREVYGEPALDEKMAARQKELETKRQREQILSLSVDDQKELDEIYKVQAAREADRTPEHPGSHVIHDEGGLKVATKADFFLDLYDKKIPRYIAKFTRQWGATVGEVNIKTGEQAGDKRYEGDEPSLSKLNKVGRAIAGGDDAGLKSALKWTLEEMKSGKKFSEIMVAEAGGEGGAYHRLAEKFGGKIVKEVASKFEKVHALNMTWELAQAAMYQSFPLFQAAERGTRGFYDPRQNVIALMKIADPSTFLHESAHVWLKDAFDFVRSGQANAAYLADWKETAEWLGIKDDQQTLTVAQQEKFAKSFEAYLFEGNAPSEGLRGAFTKLRRWLSRIYKSVQGSLGVELSPEVRRIMDRMLATEEEIESARQETGYVQIELENVDPAVAARIQDLQQKARDVAEDILLKEQMGQLQAQNEAFLKSERARITERVENFLSKEPLYEAQDYLRRKLGLANDQFTERPVTNAAQQFLEGKLDDAKIAEFETAAELNGFASGQDLARKLVAAKPLDRAVADIVNAEMSRFDQPNRDQMRESARQAIYSDPNQMLELLALEKEALENLVREAEIGAEIGRRRRQEARVEAKAAKDFARESLAKKPIREATAFKPYVTAERNAAVRVARAIAAKDYAKATKAKSEQMLNHALAAEALKNKREADKTFAYLTKFERRGQDLMSMPYGFVRQIDELLARFGLATPRAQNVETLRAIAIDMQRKGSSVEEIANATSLKPNDQGQWVPETITDLVARVNENYYAMSVPESVTGAEFKGYGDMTMGELRDVKATVKILSNVGRTFVRFLSDFIKGDIKEAAAKLRASVEAKIGTPYAEQLKVGSAFESPFKEKVAKLLQLPDAVIPELVNLLTLAHYLDGGEVDGPVKEYIYRPLKIAEDRKLVRYEKMTKEINAILASYFTPEELASYKDRRIYSNEIGRHFTFEEILAVALNWGNEGNRDRIRDGFGIDDIQVEALLANLGERDWHAAQSIWNYLAKFWPDITKLEMLVRGSEPKAVEAVPVKTRFGTFKGGYFPIAYDFAKSSEAYKNAEQKNALYKQFSASAAHTDTGHAKARLTSVKRPVRLSLDTLWNHLENVVHDLEYRTAIIDVARVLREEDVRVAITNAIGVRGFKAIEDTLKAVASDQGEFLTFADKAFRWFRYKATFATLAYRAFTLPLDLTGNAFNAVWEIGPKRFGESMKNFILDPGATKQFVQEKSERMRRRSQLRDRDIMELSRKWAGKESGFKQYGFIVQALADEAISYPLWAEVYRFNLEKMGEEKAKEVADEAVTRTVGSGSVLDQVGAQRGGEGRKIFSMYYTWLSMMFNRAWLEGRLAGLQYNKGNTGAAIAIIAKTTLFAWLLQSINENFWRELFRNREDDDEDARKKRILARAISQPFGYVWVVRDIAGFTIDKAIGRQASYRFSPLEQSVESILTTAGKGAKIAFTDDELDMKYLEEAARSGSYMTGIPLQINNMVFNFIDWIEGNGDLTWRDALTRRTRN